MRGWAVDGTEGADGFTAWRVNGDAEISHNAQIRNRQIVLEQGMIAGIGHSQGTVMRNDILTERMAERRFMHGARASWQATLCLEVLPVCINERRKSDRHTKKGSRKARNAGETLFRRAVHDSGRVQSRQPRRIGQPRLVVGRSL